MTDRYTAINRKKKRDPSDFYSLPGLSWITVLAKTKIKLELLTYNDMLLMV